MQSPQGMPYGSLPRSLAEQALQKAQATPVVNLAPFSIQRSMSGKQDKGAHAAAERMQKASHDVLQRQILAFVSFSAQSNAIRASMLMSV